MGKRFQGVACSRKTAHVVNGYTERYTSNGGCVACIRERTIVWKATPSGKEHVRKYNRDRVRRLYGVEPEDVERLLREQKGACAICRQPFKNSKATHVDHDHKTGKVRGVLCSECNQGIGKLGDTAESVMRAAEYLVAFEEKQRVAS